MKHLFIAFIILLTFNVEMAKATNLRGQIVRYADGRYYPLANVRVDFMLWNGRTQKWEVNSYAVTGADGFYYFMNFQPGITFCISVLGRFYPPKPLVTQSLPPNSYQDVPVIST
jgi:hypothetical protein